PAMSFRVPSSPRARARWHARSRNKRRSRSGRRNERWTPPSNRHAAPGSNWSRAPTSSSCRRGTGSKDRALSPRHERPLTGGNDVLALPALRLKPEREKSARAGHPWLFSGAFSSLPDLEPGSLCRVEDEHGKFVAVGYANPKRSLAVRLLAWREIESVQALLE